MKPDTNFKLMTVLLFAALTFYGCKKDGVTTTGITGTWTNSIFYAKAQRYNQTIVFNADSTVQLSHAVVDSASGSILGYQYLSNGKFRLNGNQLKLYKLVTLHDTVANTYYLLANKLTLLKTDTLENETIVMNASATSFYFIVPPCPVNANCIGQVIYTRQ